MQERNTKNFCIGICWRVIRNLHGQSGWRGPLLLDYVHALHPEIGAALQLYAWSTSSKYQLEVLTVILNTLQL
jgi:hypothetical protein